MQIIEVEDDEESMSPSKIFTIYQQGYKNQFVKETTNNYIIDLIPEKSSSFIKVELRVNKKEMRIAGFTLFDKNGGTYAYDVQLFKANQTFKEDFFQINTSAHPYVDVIDLR